jgi:hypothetical protein
MKIPKRFKLLGQTIEVKFDPSVQFEEGQLSWAKFNTMEIILQPSTEQTYMPEKKIEHNFFHEFVHHIFYAAGSDSFDPPLHKQEFFVDLVAGLLHQALSTMEYEDE